MSWKLSEERVPRMKWSTASNVGKKLNKVRE